jgi:hypothetical protein
MGDRTVVIEQVEVIRGDGNGDAEARREIERLLSKWLVRAYIKRYNDDMEDEPQSQICKGSVEVLR